MQEQLVRKKALRKLKVRFAKLYGRVPNGPMVQGIRISDGAIAYLPSEVRRIKKGSIEL